MRLQQLYLALLLATVSAISVQDPRTCPSSQYFNLSYLACQACEVPNSQPNSEGDSCSCKPRYRAVFDAANQMLKSCEQCQIGFTFQGDPTQCYPATGSVVGVNNLPACAQDDYIPYLAKSGQIDCRPCPYGQFAVKQVTTGECIKCPHPRQKYGFVNSEYKCSCMNDTEYQDLDGTITCVLKSDANKLPDLTGDVYINYKQIEKPGGAITSAKVRSPYLANNYREMYYKCLIYLNPTSCQSLANMCVMNMYNPDSASCKVLDTIQGTLPAVSDQPYNE